MGTIMENGERRELQDTRTHTRTETNTQSKTEEPVTVKRMTSDVHFRFEEKASETQTEPTVISEELDAAFRTTRSKEYMQILQKMRISAMTDEEIKLVIAREIIRGGAESTEEVVELSTFSDVEDEKEILESALEEEKELAEEMSDEDVEEFLRMISASIEETIAKEELKLKSYLVELDQKAIDESYHLTLCPITPSHDIHILPKDGHLYFCHLTNSELPPVFVEAKRLLQSREASLIHVYKGCAFVVDSSGKVTKRIDVVEEPVDLIIAKGWQELP